MHCQCPGATLIGVFSKWRKKIEGVRLYHHLGIGVRMQQCIDGELHPQTLGVSNRGKALINIKANQILKHESLATVAVYQCCVHL